jgi:hypothetical protein
MHRTRYFVVALIALGSIAMIPGETGQKSNTAKTQTALANCDSLILRGTGSDTMSVWVCGTSTTYTFIPDTPGFAARAFFAQHHVVKLRRVHGGPAPQIKK